MIKNIFIKIFKSKKIDLDKAEITNNCTINKGHDLDFYYIKNNRYHIHSSLNVVDTNDINNIVKDTKEKIINEEGATEITIYQSDWITCENVYCRNGENKARCLISDDYCEEFKDSYKNRPCY